MVKNQLAKAFIKGDFKDIVTFISGILVSTSSISLLLNNIGVNLTSYFVALLIGIVVVVFSKEMFNNKTLLYMLNLIGSFIVSSSIFLIFVELIGEQITNIAGIIIGIIMLFILRK